ncbi:conserved hypothetical protein [Ricinus communis]|uniref:Protein kinase domain-containing protein n=1 Tax=Ricinus communis TaxID=3988 RepID=B9RQ92_RICCO|nr:conserved hypothetical protein [Ricinus communis]
MSTAVEPASATEPLNFSIRSEVIPSYSTEITVYPKAASIGRNLNFSLDKTGYSTLPPPINVIEIYDVFELSQVQSDQGDVDTITKIKSIYNIKRNWQGDPCAPQAYEGLNCSYNDYDAPRIISLNLSSSGLSGDITPYISNLTLLETLDLSNNSLSESVPDFLSHMSSLKVLNISGNQLTGSVPSALLEKSKKNLLVLSSDGNPDLCASFSCKKKNNTFVVPIVASVGTALIIMAALAVWFWSFRRRKQQEVWVPETKYRQPTYAEVLKITNNLERVLGKGGYGTVYHGFLHGIEVAVKMLSPLSVQGSIQFQAEVPLECKLLLRVHHRNLTILVGFCDEGTNMGLIYEYMVNGDLERHLSVTNTNVLSWKRRLQIAIDAAKGLEYLHNGCRPPIIRRDVKTSNILLNDTFQAKLADFGLSRPFPVEGGTHVSTTVVGTPGYLDPDALAANGDIKSIVDPRLTGDFNINSIWKAVETALACSSPTSARRPAMLQVVTELNECLEEEIARSKVIHGIELNGSTGVIDDSIPLAR